MDVDLMMNYQVEESNDDEKFLAYNQAQGARMSAMEHLVPEQMFSTEENPANGISAVKALQIAGAEGQRIWTITSENVDVAIPNLNLPDDIISEIRNSAAAGLEITTHEQPVSFYGSSQVGYIILDPATGAGAYKIGGGENGSYMTGLYLGLALSLAAVMALAFSGGLALPLLLSVLLHASLIEGLAAYDNFDRKCFFAGLFAGLSATLVAFVKISGSLEAIFGSILSALGYSNAIFDLDGSREGCFGG